ncbi:MAG: phosphatase [Clostridium butyricum]|nr:phosphatase [Clostridium butyricum]
MKALVDLHTHTISSGHAFSTLKENIEEARNKGLEVLGTSDHFIEMPGTAHLSFFGNYKVIKEEIMGVRILKGVEANIVNYNGEVDLTSGIYSSLDYIIASLHPPCIKPGTIEENTNAILNAMKNPYIKIIGHPDDGRFPLDYKRLIEGAKKTNTVLELNNSSLHPKAFRLNAYENLKVMLELCAENEVNIILGSDSHIYYDIGEFKKAYDLLKELNFPKELVINFDLERLNKILINR